MKIFLQVLIMGVLLSTPILLEAQQKGNAFQFGIGANALIGITNARTFQTGWGTEFYGWIEKAAGKKGTINLSLAYRQQLGFQRKAMEIDIYNQPREMFVVMRNKELAALEYLDARLTWRHRFKEKSPWSFGCGLRASHLVHWQGAELSTIWNSRGYVYTRGGGNIWEGSISQAIQVNDASPLTADNFRRMDFGAQFELSYELLAGLQVILNYSQGFRNAFQEKFLPGKAKYRMSNLSLGLSTRLF